MSREDEDIVSQRGEILFYQAEDGSTRLECRFEDETIWLSQAMLCELYQKSKATISEHLKNIFQDNELQEDSVVRFFRTTAADGKEYNVKHFNLDAILAVGYRVRSQRGTQFRRWATERLREYLVKGFTMDDERLKNPPVAGSGVPDYFDEMLERIRDIRASERRMYLRVKEIFAMAGDYDPSWPETTKFFRVIQNKLHYAATGMTAAELIQRRANHELPNMGLTSWKGDEVRKTDVTIAKNYLDEPEIDELNRIVVMWLDFAEDQARRRKQIFMQDWEQKLDEFLAFNERRVLSNAGSVSKKAADERARKEYEQFAERRRKHKEAIGETEAIKVLEDAAKHLEMKRPEDKE
ncbi:virulence RhuM family protein [Thiolapillus sp.]|uniref:virulence RhuM family protein n=1 Tax=Thiolapillus sp. TaxID=2017437 RepID=UPI003AF50FB3